MEPSGAINISQALFMMDEKISQKNMGLRSGSDHMKVQTPVLINQSRLSTYYQDNPWSTLSFSQKYGLETLGGPIDGSKGSGHRPGNIFVDKSKVNMNIRSLPAPVNNMEYINYSGVNVPFFMSRFGSQ
jgi:hypothetical protein